MTFVTTERAAISDLLESVGPEAPTMCGEWTTRLLAAHLILREGRLDAAAGILLPPFAGYTEKVQGKIAAQPWLKTVRDFRTGPPWYSAFRIPAIDRLANGGEFFVHHEDIRRAQPDWEPRPIDPVRTKVLVAALERMGKLLYRSAPVGVRLEVEGGPTVEAKHVSARGTVTVGGPAEEVALHAFGRESVSRATLDGAPEDLDDLRATKREM